MFYTNNNNNNNNNWKALHVETTEHSHVRQHAQKQFRDYQSKSTKLLSRKILLNAPPILTTEQM
jgi:hypothetical protein